MIRTDRCPVCGETGGRSWPGLVAPFIAEYALDAPVQSCVLHECAGCGLRYFAERFTGPELARLYSDYRGARYFRVRHRHEPWYTERFHQRVMGRDDGAGQRQAALKAFLRDSGAPADFDSILDYGGDAGQLIPQDIARERFVFDISGAPAVSGVVAINSESSLREGGYHLVLLSHVLEHIPEPVDMLRTVRRAVRRDDGLLYMEVPFERPYMGLALRGSIGQAYVSVLRRSAFAVRTLDFYSSASRLKAGMIPPLGFPKLSEHLNFFARASLAAVLERSGFVVMRIAPTSTQGAGGPQDAIACVARPVTG